MRLLFTHLVAFLIGAFSAARYIEWRTDSLLKSDSKKPTHDNHSKN